MREGEKRRDEQLQPKKKTKDESRASNEEEQRTKKSCHFRTDCLGLNMNQIKATEQASDDFDFRNHTRTGTLKTTKSDIDTVCDSGRLIVVCTLILSFAILRSRPWPPPHLTSSHSLSCLLSSHTVPCSALLQQISRLS